MYKMIIADDEKIEQRVLQKMVQEFCPQIQMVACVSNGLKLLECIELQKPDIVVLDINMPVMNGLDALEIIRLKKNDTKIVVVTAYSKFEFAKRALSLGAEEYILKPVNEQIFVQTIQKICGLLDKEKKSDGQEDRQQQVYRQVLESELISNLLLGEINRKNQKRYMDLIHEPLYGICAVAMKAGFLQSEENGEHILRELKRFCNCFGKMYKGDLILCLFPASEEEKTNYQTWITELFDCLAEAVVQVDWDTAFLGVSDLKSSLEEMIEGMKESQIILRGVEQSGLHFYREENKVALGCNYKKELLECQMMLEHKNSIAFQERMKDVFETAEKSDISLNFLRVFSYSILFGGKFQEEIPFSFYENSWKCWEELLKLKKPEDIGRYLIEWEKGKKSFQENIPEHNPYIRKSLNYMMQHYMKELSMDIVASEINISSFYLSRLFKQAFNRTFLEVLTDIRFTRGIDLLYEGNENIQQISYRIGYANVSYFYRLFKKKMGMTAGEMKEYLQNL